MLDKLAYFRGVSEEGAIVSLGDPSKFTATIPMQKDPSADMSFSGLGTHFRELTYKNGKHQKFMFDLNLKKMSF